MECIDPINEITLTHGFRQERISCGRVQNSSNRWMVEIVSLCHARSRTARRNPDRMNVAAASRSQLACRARARSERCMGSGSAPHHFVLHRVRGTRPIFGDRHTFASSRRVSPELCCLLPPFLKARAQGRPGAGWHPQSRVRKNAHGVDHRCRRSPGLPCAVVFTVSFALSSGSVALLPPSPCGCVMHVPVGRHISAKT